MRLESSRRVQDMIAPSSSVFGKVILAALFCLALIGLAPGSAQARVFFGFGVPFPGYYGPPAYYPPPPVYYAPPPVVYAPQPQISTPPPQFYTPPAAAPSAAGQACYAGSYTCPMDHPVASGASCYCPSNSGQRVWGRAN